MRDSLKSDYFEIKHFDYTDEDIENVIADLERVLDFFKSKKGGGEKEEDKKQRIIDLLIQKNKIVNRIAELYEERGLYDLDEEQSEEHSKLVNENSDILEELTGLGYTREIK